MDKQYSIINQCLRLLKESQIPTIKKLKVEIQLIQMKRLLLNESVSTEVRESETWQDLFEGLLAHMRNVCEGSCECEALNALMDRIAGMLITLGGSSTAT